MKTIELFMAQYRLMSTHLKVFLSTFILASLTYVGFSRTILLVLVSLFSVLVMDILADFTNPFNRVMQRLKEKWNKK